MSDLVPEGIDAAGVTRWLSQCRPELVTPLTFTLIAGGHSNLTYLCTDAAGHRYVLRRPPLGSVLQSAHDMGREYRIVTALRDSAVPVANTYGLCTDVTVNGAPFFVMDFVDGVVLHNAEMARQMAADERLGLSEHVVQVLAALHSIAPASVGLGDLGRHDSYIERQLKRWTRQWLASTTHPIPAMEDSLGLLQERLPVQIGTAIVHGDYRLGNFIVAGKRIQAVLDWELCTLGDPLADVGYFLNWWVSPNETTAGPTDTLPTAAGGFPHREELAARYTELTGRDTSEISYYRAFSYWRLAAIRQGVYKRYLEGAMGSDTDVDLATMKRSVEQCAEAALLLLHG